MRTTWKPFSNKTKLTFLLTVILSFTCLSGSSFGGFLKDLSENKQDQKKMLLAHITNFTHTHANGEEHLKRRLTPEEIRIRDEKAAKAKRIRDEKAAKAKRIAEENLKNAIKGFMPEQQKEFLNIVKTHADKYKNAKSEIKKSLYRKKRIKAFSDFFSTSLCFDSWVGTVKSLNTDKDGDAILGINIGGFLFFNYAPRAIPMSNSLFDTVAELEENDQVVLSGCFSKHMDVFSDNWYLFTHENTEKGAMTSPTFQGSYSDIKKVNK